MLSSILILALAAAAPLVDAVKSGDRAAAMTLIAQRADVNAPEADGTTPLHWAVHRGDLELAQRLIRAGAKVNVKNDYGSTPMAEAAILGRADLLEALLKAGADVESPNADGQTALMIVARSGRVDAARLLLKYGANVNAVEQWRGQTALMWAVAQKQPAMVAELVKAGADVNARSMVNNWDRQVTAEPRAIYRPAGGLTPLLYAAREGCAECARLLVDAGADLDLADPENISPLLMAVINAQWDTAQYLIKKGANPNKWDFWGRAPLYAAVDFNTLPHGGRPDRPSLSATSGLETIELLLASGANPNAQLKMFPPYRSLRADRGADGVLGIGTTPLIRAARAADLGAMRLLLAHDARVDLPQDGGITALMVAAGMDRRAIDTRGKFTREEELVKAARLLLDAGANPALVDERGRTALHAAASQGMNEMVRLLVAHGADPLAADASGRTPLDHALGTGAGRGGATEPHEETARLLESLIASR